MSAYLWGPEKDLIVPTPKPVFLMHDDDSGRCQMHAVGVPEKPIIEWAKKFGSPEKVFIDCGAHMGAYSILLADSFETVYAFEAQRRTYWQLCGNIFLNEKKNIVPMRVAVTDTANSFHTATLSIVSEDGGGSTILPPHGKEVIETEEVDTTHIDLYAYRNVGLIKLDIEGNELKALQGAEQTIKLSDYPPLIFEANNDEWFANERTHLFEYLRHNLGYTVSGIKPFPNMYAAILEKEEQTSS